MIVAAHQPNFAPWLGFFDRMRKADMFILVDHVQFERQNYQNRTKVKTGEGPRWLTVPVRQQSRAELIRDKAIDNAKTGRLRWGRKAFLSLQYSYQAAPYFKEYAPALLDLFDRQWDRLLDLNLALLEICRDAFDIRTPLIRSSDLAVTGTKSDMVLQLCRAVGADVYLAGMGGSRGYLDVAEFERAGIRVVWQDFRHPRYRQHPKEDCFIEGVSALDSLFNCGPRGKSILRGEVYPYAHSHA